MSFIVDFSSTRADDDGQSEMHRLCFDALTRSCFSISLSEHGCRAALEAYSKLL